MEGFDCRDWKSFEQELQSLREELAKSAPDKRCPELLFRGQSDSEWELTTTLERAGCTGMSFDAYYRRAVSRVRPAVETFTGVKWDVDEYSLALIESFCGDRELFSPGRFPSVPLYRYFVYLRHLGFPSPLLDWTASVHVTAFFAFREAGKPQARSIYVYCERPNVIKGGAVGEPAMRPLGLMYEVTADIFANDLTTLSARTLNPVPAGISTRTNRYSGVASRIFSSSTTSHQASALRCCDDWMSTI